MNEPHNHAHTYKRYDKELGKLKQQVERMGDQVSRQLALLLGHLEDFSDKSEFDDIIENDESINGMEIKAGKTIIKLLAKRAPVGSDLRFIISASRIVTELERIGDEVVVLARSLAESSQLPNCDKESITVNMAGMVALAMNLLDRALLAVQNDDIDTALAMIEKQLNKEGSYHQQANELVQCIKKNHDSTDQAFDAALQANALTRVCDHVCNICEHVVFLVSGDDIRHQDDSN